MKLHTLISTCFLLIASQGVMAQDAEAESPWKVTMAVSSLSITISGMDDYNQIDWDELRSTFADNPENEPVQIAFVLKQEGAQNGTPMQQEFIMSFHGTKENVDGILASAKKSLLALLTEE